MSELWLAESSVSPVGTLGARSVPPRRETYLPSAADASGPAGVTARSKDCSVAAAWIAVRQACSSSEPFRPISSMTTSLAWVSLSVTPARSGSVFRRTTTTSTLCKEAS